MVEGPAAMWDNLEVSFPKIKKFRNNKAKFPLFDALGELYDGHLAEGTYNFTSLEPPREEEHLQCYDVQDETQDLDSIEVHEVLDEDDAITEAIAIERTGQRDTLSREEKSEVAVVERSGQQRTATMTSRNKQKEEEKRPRRAAKIEDMMGRYLEMRTKQAEDESTYLAREKDVVEGNDFSIKRCISILNTMPVTKEEKAKAYPVFIKSKENREVFICACEEDAESALIWLRNEMM